MLNEKSQSQKIKIDFSLNGLNKMLSNREKKKEDYIVYDSNYLNKIIGIKIKNQWLPRVRGDGRIRE